MLTSHLFVQLCSMARDMSKKVRIEAFDALGNVKEVSESALLQSLSKKVLGNRSGSKIVSKCEKETKLSFSRAAGTFIHGIEDEHHEVNILFSCYPIPLFSHNLSTAASDSLQSFCC